MMYTESNPDHTITINFEDDEWEVVTAYAQKKGLSTSFFIALGLQMLLRNLILLFPRRLLYKSQINRRCHSNYISQGGGI